MWAIRNKRTRKWLYGTDFRRYPYTQRTSEDKAMTFDEYEDACFEFNRRMCGKSYEVVPVRLEALEQ